MTSLSAASVTRCASGSARQFSSFFANASISALVGNSPGGVLAGSVGGAVGVLTCAAVSTTGALCPSSPTGALRLVMATPLVPTSTATWSSTESMPVRWP